MAQKKDAYYFKHDATTPNDPKIIKLRRILGREGSDVFFDILCKLRQESEHQLPESCIPDLAYDLRYPETKLRKLLNEFELFKFVDGFFHSPRLTRDMEEYNAKKAVYQQRAKKGGEAKAKQNPASSRIEADLNSATSLPIIYNNTKENKSNESQTALSASSTDKPADASLEKVSEYFAQAYCYDKAQIELFFYHYESIGWSPGGQKISSVKALVNKWLTNNAGATKPVGRQVEMEYFMGGTVMWSEEKYQQYCNNPASSGYTFVRYAD